MHATCLVFVPLGSSIDDALTPFWEEAGEGQAKDLMYSVSNDADVPDHDNLAELKEEYKSVTGEELSDDEYYVQNLQGRWDWYQVGGRWAGFLTAKKLSEYTSEGERSWGNNSELEPLQVSSGRVSDIDWHGMVKEKKEAIKPAVTFLCNALRDLPLSVSVEDLAEGVEYHKQPRQEAFKAMAQEEEILGPLYGLDPLDFNLSADELLQQVSTDRLGTYAVITNGDWLEDFELTEKHSSKGAYILDHVESLTEEEKDSTMVYLVDYHS